VWVHTFWRLVTANLWATKELSAFMITECATCGYSTCCQGPEQHIQQYEMVPFGKSLNILTMTAVLITHKYKPRLNLNRNIWPFLSLDVSSTLIHSYTLLLLQEQLYPVCVCVCVRARARAPWTWTISWTF
jgi:hypothetical protein